MTNARALIVALTLFITSMVGVAATSSSANATYAGRDGKIAFVRANQIYTMSSTGTGVTKLTSTGKNYRPKWSPDGKRISYINEVNGQRDIWVMLANGGTKQRVTRLGDVSPGGAMWSPDGRTLAFANPALRTVRSTSPFGSPVTLTGYQTNSESCSDDDPSERSEVYVDRFLAWSPDGTRIAVLGTECRFDDAIWMYYPATGELRQYMAGGGDCCGYQDWLEFFWGPQNQFGYTYVDRGAYGDESHPSKIIYSGFTSTGGDTGGAPSPSGTYMALTNASSGAAQIFRTSINGTGRRFLTNGYQPDWQRLP